MQLNISVSGIDDVTLNLKNYSERFPKALIRRLTQDIHDESVKNASVHTKTGTMENNIALRVRGLKGKVFIEDDGMMVSWKGKPINYAVFVHFGTHPHKILPKNRKSLRFPVGSKKFLFVKIDTFQFAKAVRHPGYKGDEFMYNAARDVFKRLDQIAKEVHYATK